MTNQSALALAALRANEQCIADFVEMYKRGCSNIVMDEAVKSLKNDALKLTRAAIADLSQPEPVNAAQVTGERAEPNEGWIDHAKHLQSRLDCLNRELDLRKLHQDKNCWYWQGDGTDHPESISNSMCIVIRGDQLRELLSPAPTRQEREPEEQAMQKLDALLDEYESEVSCEAYNHRSRHRASSEVRKEIDASVRALAAQKEE